MEVYMTTLSSAMPRGIFIVKDRISALTHFLGFLISLVLLPLFLVAAGQKTGNLAEMVSLAVFFGSMTLLYGASAAYHAFNVSPRINLWLKRLDHASIFLLIAGSYTPVCVLALPRPLGRLILAVVWAAAAAGILFKLFYVTCPRWVSSLLYIAMGWVCVFVLPTLWQTLGAKFYLLAAEGFFYTLGGVIYAWRKPLFPNEAETGFGNHEFFHLLVLAGSLCHVILLATLI